MRTLGAVLLTLTMGGTVFAQEDQQPRLYVTDSGSWEVRGGFGGGDGDFGGGIAGGARPQTAEIIKTFGERCPEAIITMNEDAADYIVLLDHEGGKDIFRRDNKFALFNEAGDVIGSGSTRALGNAVKDACQFLFDDWRSRAPAQQAAEDPSAAEGT